MWTQNNKKKIIIFLFSFILLIAACFRFIGFESNPPSLTWDETAWGYNAYTLGIDAKDEFGRFLPHDYLESFGDFKPPLYAYLTILPVKLFGLTEFATRFPSAFFGSFTVLITFFLVKRLFYSSVYKSAYALFAALILAISPWHTMLSRAAFEANVATFFIVLGVYLFLYAIQEKRFFLALSFISFVLSMYTFNTARIVSPLLVIGLLIGFHKTLLRVKKIFIISAIIGFMCLLPILPFLFSPQASLRFKEVNIFSDLSVTKMINQEVANDNNSEFSKIIHNRRFVFSALALKHYLDHFNPYYLFIKGDRNPKFSTQDLGELYLLDLPFLIIGILFLIRKREKNWWIIFYWLLVGIIPAATARETPHALRTEAALPTFQIIIAYGVVTSGIFLKRILSKNIRLVAFSGYFFLLLINSLYFLHGYINHYSREYSSEWQYGYKESINYVKSVQNQYDAVVISDVLGRPYIYYLFYLRVNPKDFRQQAKIVRDPFGFVHVKQFDKYYFREKNEKLAINGGNILYIGGYHEIPVGAHILKKFYLLDNTPTLIAYTL